MEELDGAGVADVLLVDRVPDAPELVFEVVGALLAAALPIGLAAITPTKPVNARPVSAAAARRARAAG